jgi:hypothetical protein
MFWATFWAIFSPTHLGPIFRTFFSGENFGENSAENFPPKMLGKIAIFRGKSFEKSFFQQIPRNFPRKNHFPWKKMYEISAAGRPGAQ